jgi:hypothetical protein
MPIHWHLQQIKIRYSELSMRDGSGGGPSSFMLIEDEDGRMKSLLDPHLIDGEASSCTANPG